MLGDNWLLSVVEHLDIQPEYKYTLHELLQTLLERRDIIYNADKRTKKSVQDQLSKSITRKFTDADVVLVPDQLAIATPKMETHLRNRSRTSYRFFKLEVNNYRQFAGPQTLSFGTEASAAITVVRGENGAGKTNLLNAMSWCLFGQEQNQSQKKGLRTSILSSTVARSLRDGEVAEVAVTLSIGQLQPEFRVHRSTAFLKKGEELEQKSTQFSVYSYEGSSVGWRESNNPTTIVNKIIPKKFMDFFFFDGEYITSYFQPGGEKEITNAIHSVSDLRVLEELSSYLKVIQRSMRQKVTRGRPEMTDLAHALATKEKELEHQQTLLSNFQKQVSDLDAKLQLLSNQIDHLQIEEAVELKEEQTNLNQRIAKLENKLRYLTLKANECLVRLLPYALLHTHNEKTLLKISTSKQQSSLVKGLDYHPSLLEKILTNKKCLCGRPLDHGSEAKIEELRETKGKRENQTVYIQEMYQFLTTAYTEELPNLYNQYKDLKLQLSECEEELGEYLTRLSEVNLRLETVADTQTHKLRHEYKKVSDGRDKVMLKRGEVEGLCNQLELEISQIQRTLDKSLAQAKEFKQQENLLNALGNLLTIVENMHQHLTDFVRVTVQDLTTNHFLTLVWKKDSFSHIEIDRDYKFKVFGVSNDDRFADLSAGERQVLAYSFIAALTQVSGFDAPVVIDTPLGRISILPRREIASKLPLFLKNTQITILFTDAEYTEEVRTRMKDRVSREYLLNFDAQTETCTVQEVGTHD